jgi:hypothetical protein
MPMLVELSEAVTMRNLAAGAECPPAAAGAAPFPFDALVLAAAPPGCHSSKSSFSIGFTVLPNREASSDTRAVSTRCDAFMAATTSPATLMFPAV